MSDLLDPPAPTEDVPDWQATVLRLSRLAAARPDNAAQVAADEREQRRANLRYARVYDVDAMAACLASSDAPPVVAGHRGSEAASAAVAEFHRDERLRTLTLCGPTGTGKTWGATWLLQHTDSGLLLPFGGVCVSPEWDSLRRHAQAVRVLVINDLAAPASAWVANEVATLIGRRHDEAKRTVVTTNHPVDRAPAGVKPNPLPPLRELFGDRVADRLLDGRYARKAVCAGASLRSAAP